MGQYTFRAVDTNNRPLAGVTIEHDLGLCPHYDACAICNDFPYTRGGMTARETINPVVRTTGADGMAYMVFGTCENNHTFRYQYMGLEPISVEPTDNGSFIHLQFDVPVPAPPPAPPTAPVPVPEPPTPPDDEQGQVPEGQGAQDSGWPVMIDPDAAVHVCQSPTQTTGQPCKRRTRTPYCYQHTAQVTAEMKDYAGKWTMNGYQVNVPRSGWEAELNLKADGTFDWKETKGANVGAGRNGNWVVENAVFKMYYFAPNVGLVTWEAPGATATNMNGTYRTPEVDPHGAGWGGDWHANKMPA